MEFGVMAEGRREKATTSEDQEAGSALDGRALEVEALLQDTMHGGGDGPEAGLEGGKAGAVKERDRRRAWSWIVGISAGILVASAVLYAAVSRVEALQSAGKKALLAGIPGAAAMVVQVFALMWARTIVNYQYRHGVSMTQAATTLWQQGGIPRLYRGLGPALIQGPLSRFGDTAANDGMQALLDSHVATAGFPLWMKSLVCSFAAGLWRIFIMPVDTLKTKMQVEGKDAVSALIAKLVRQGPGCLYEGWLANQVASMMGHYPWFAARNYLRLLLPEASAAYSPLRDGFIGLCSSVVSDIVSNCARILKTYKQTSPRDMSYTQVIAAIVQINGPSGLFLRGLKTKLLTNALQSILFNVMWEYFKSRAAEI